jgi:hypothetical protein
MEIRVYLNEVLTSAVAGTSLPPMFRGLSRMLLLMRSSRFAVVLLAASLSASTITISASGMFDKTTGSSAFSGPDETWAFSFVVDSMPAVSNVNPGNYFDVAFSDFEYSLNGSPVAIRPDDIRFFSASQYGGFSICFTVACSFFNNPTDGFAFIEFPQMYTGSESAPTMQTGEFGPHVLYVFANTNQQYLTAFQDVLAVATPEPSTIPTLGGGILLGLAGLRLRRRT